MKISWSKFHPARFGMVSNSTQNIPTVVRLEKNIPTELIRKSSRYCIFDLIY